MVSKLLTQLEAGQCSRITEERWLAEKSGFIRHGLDGWDLSAILSAMDVDVIDLSNPLWKDPQFPNFYRNEKYLEPLEAGLKKISKKLRSAREFGDVAITEILANSAIEGVFLSVEKITSSYLGNLAGPSGKRENNAVDAMMLAMRNYNRPLTSEFVKEINRLFNELPNRGEYVGGVNIIKSTRLDRVEIVERGAPPEIVAQAMADFIDAYNRQKKGAPLFNAISGHVHFEKIHPFSDGNGRTGRVLMQMALMRDLEITHPVAISRAIQKQKAVYYDSLGKAGMDLTQTVSDLSPMMILAFKETERISVLTGYRKKSYSIPVNDRQRKALEHLVSAEMEGGYVGKFTSGKYQALTKTSDRSALRDLQELVDSGLLVKKGALKGTHYMLPLAEEG